MIGVKSKIIFLLVIVLSVFISVSQANTFTAKEILDQAEKIMDLGQYRADARMVIETTGGDQRTLELEIWGKGTDKAFMKYTNPARIRGVTFLFYEDDIWSYFPSTGRIRHLASHIKNQKMMGSSFSYDDMTSTYQDYEGKIIQEEKINGQIYDVIEGKAKAVDQTYEKIFVWIARGTFLPLKMDFYQEGEKVKTMQIESYLQVNGESKPEKIIMKDLLNNDETLFEYLKLETNENFEDDFFNQRQLKRLAEQ